MHKTILVLDKDEIIKYMLSDVLSSEKYTVINEKSTKKALTILSFDRIDIILSQSSFFNDKKQSFIKKVKQDKRNSDTVIVIIGEIADDNKLFKKLISDYKCIKYLKAPITPSELVSSISSACNQSVKEKKADNIKMPEDDYIDHHAKNEKNEVETEIAKDIEDDNIFKGDLNGKIFLDILVEHYINKSTGTLLVRQQSTSKIIYLENGQPVFVKSNLLNECLGKLMVNDGIINTEICKKSINVMKQTGKKQGEVLIEAGDISQKNLNYALQKQLEYKLHDIFSWNSGVYIFKAKKSLTNLKSKIAISGIKHILEGVKKLYHKKDLEKVFNELKNNYVSINDINSVKKDLKLSENKLTFALKLNGTKAFKTILLEKKSGHSPLLRLTETLKLVNALTIKSSPETSKTKETYIKTEYPVSKTKIPISKPVIKSKDSLQKNINTNSENTNTKSVSSVSNNNSSNTALQNESPDMDYLFKKKAQFEKQNYFEVLGVSDSANSSEIKTAYFKLAKEFHPDKYYNSTASAKAISEEIFTNITKAHEVLSEDNSREEYKRNLSKGITDVKKHLNEILDAEEEFKLGEKFMKAGNYGQALNHFKEANKLNPKEPEYKAFLGWAIYQQNPDDQNKYSEAIKLIQNSIKENPNIEQAFIFYGNILKLTGRQEDAHKQFLKAVKINPQNIEAMREIRLYNMRKTTKKKKGFSFFSRK